MENSNLCWYTRVAWTGLYQPDEIQFQPGEEFAY
jgi:hypothetical protein